MGSCCVRVSFSGLLPCAREAFLGSCCVRGRLSWGAVCARGFSGLAHYKMQTKCKTKANACICVAWKASFSICARKASFSSSRNKFDRLIVPPFREFSNAKSKRCIECKHHAKQKQTLGFALLGKHHSQFALPRKASFSSSRNNFDRFETY